MRRLSSPARVAGACALLCAALLAAAGQLALERLGEGSREAARRQQSTLVAALADGLDARLGATRDSLAALAASLGSEAGSDPLRLQGRLASGARELGFPGGLYLLRPDGRVLAGVASGAAQPVRDYAFSDLLKLPLATGRPYISPPFCSPSHPGRPGVVISAPVRDPSGAVRAVLCGVPDLMREDLLGALSRVRVGSAGHLTLSDAAGTLLLRPRRSGIPGAPPASPRPPAGTGPGGAWSAATRDADGTPMLTCYRGLPATGWTLALSVPQAELDRGVAGVTRFFWTALALAWAAALTLAWWLVSRSRAPLRELARGMAATPDAPPLPEGSGGGALQELARACNGRLAQLREACGELRLLQAVLDAIPAPIFYKDPLGRYLGANRAFEEYLGQERSQLVGKTVFEVSPSELAQVYFEADRELLARGGEQQYESQAAYADGTLRDVIFYKATFDLGGGTGGIVGTLLDITERKQTESLLEEQKEFSENLVQNLAVPAFVLNSRHEVIIWNRACEELSGIAARDLLGTHRHWSAFYLAEHPTQADLVLDGDYREADNRYNPLWQRSTLIPGGMQGEGWCRNLQGLDGYLMFSSAPIRNRAGEVIAAIETVEDITGRKRAEDQLRSLSCAVEQSPSIVVITDTAGTIEYVNRKFVEVTGYSREEAVGANPRLLKAGTTPDELYGELWRSISAGKEWRGEFQNRKKNGELYSEMAVISPVQDERGIISHYIALKEDVTERRALAGALRHAQKMESLGTLTGGVAHDFNNSLTAIIGYANLIQMKSAPADPCARFAGQVVAAAEKAAVLTRGLLAYSRNQAMSPAHLDLNEVVGRVDRLLSRVLGEGIAFSTRLHPEPLRLFADSGQLEQMLMNLAVNAKDAMPEGGTLQIGTEAVTLDGEFLKRKGFGAPGRYARLSVTDSGVGLDRATRERIFEPFFTTHGAGGGPGLGLSIVHGIVESHKGHVEVESAPGRGCAFRVYLPLVLPAARAPEPERRRGPGGETVLLVEDNPEVRGSIGELLRGEGYQVLEAADSEEGMRRFTRHGRVRLLLVDVIMPGRGGLELYREIRTLDPDLRVLFMSGYPEEQIRARGVLASDLAFISKPLAPAELLRRVRGVLDGCGGPGAAG